MKLMRKLYRFGYGLVDTLASLALALLAVLNLFFGVTLIPVAAQSVGMLRGAQLKKDR